MLACTAFGSFQSSSQVQIPNPIETSNYADKQQVVNPRTGKVERVFVNLEAVYPKPNDPHEEMSFEELRALSRGWLNKDWEAETKQRSTEGSRLHTKEQSLSSVTGEEHADNSIIDSSEQNLESHNHLEEFGANLIVEDGARGGRSGRPRKTKIMEVKVETQTSKVAR